MAAYQSFAQFYDLLQADVPYERIAKLIEGFIDKYSDENEVVVDLACGTGRLSRELAALGYDVYGVDFSETMLDEAAKNTSADNVTYLCQDMTKLDLWGAADVIVCILDSLNHLESEEKLRQTVERAGMFTCDGGLFIFDVNTEYKHRQILANNCYVFEREDLFCTWQNNCDENGDVSIALDFFSKTADGTYLRESEYFNEKLFRPELIEKYLDENHFDIMGVFNDFSFDEPDEHSERLLYVCKRRKGFR